MQNNEQRVCAETPLNDVNYKSVKENEKFL